MSAHNLPPLIPRDELFGNPEKASPQISPDGARLAYLAPDEGVLNVWLRTVGKEDDKPITRDRKRGIRAFFWTFDGKHLLYIQDRAGDENWHIYSVEPDSDSIVDLTPFEGVMASLAGYSHRVPNEMLIALNKRDARCHDIYRLDLATGEITLEIENPGDIVGWVTDLDLQVRASYAAMPDGGFELRAREPDGSWRPLVTWGPDEDGGPRMMTADGAGIYLEDNRGTDTSELRLLDIATVEVKTIAGSPEADLSSVRFHPTNNRPQAAAFTKARRVWQVLDESVREDFEVLRNSTPGDFVVYLSDLEDRVWVVSITRDNHPESYWIYDRRTKKLEFLFSSRPVLENYTLAEIRPIEIKSRDGLTLQCYLTLPIGLEPKSLPMVLDVHGGPWYRDTWCFDREAQWLANRGYACLTVNFRGSTGFGKKFLHAGDREWGGKMHDDLIDSVQWAIAEGIADPKRVAIFGGSYGGYAALVGAAFTPDVFACAVDIVGPSSLRTLINSIPPYWEPMKKMFTVRVGDPETEPDFLDSRSPLYKADQIVCPMLIAQGANDPRVKQAESEQIVKALRERGKEVEYMLFEDEGHGFARPENNIKFYVAAEKFLAKHLGGRAED